MIWMRFWKDAEMTENNMIKAVQEQELDRIRHEIEVAKLQLELEQLKMKLPIKVK